MINCRLIIPGGKPKHPVRLAGWTASPWTAYVDNRGNANSGTDIQVKITLPSYFRFDLLKDDATDIRVLDANNRVLPIFIETCSISLNDLTASVVVFVVKTDVASNSNVPLYVFYGNQDATDVTSYNDVKTRWTTGVNTVARWVFDNASSSANDATLLDVTGNKTLTFHGAHCTLPMSGLFGEKVCGVNVGRSGGAKDSWLTLAGILDTMTPSGTVSMRFKQSEMDGDSYPLIFEHHNGDDPNSLLHGLYFGGYKPNHSFYGRFDSDGDASDGIGAIDATGEVSWIDKWSLMTLTWDQGYATLYVNGQIIRREFIGISLWQNKPGRDTFIGRWRHSTDPRYSTLLVSEIEVLSRPKTPSEIDRDVDYSKHLPGSYQYDKWSEEGVVQECRISNPDQRSGGGTKLQVQEPSTIWVEELGLWLRWYTAAEKQIWLDTSPNHINWTVVNNLPVIGFSNGSASVKEDAQASHAEVLRDGDRFYCFYAADSSGEFRVAYADLSDMLLGVFDKWHLAGKCVDTPTYGTGVLGNLSVAKDPSGTYVMAIEIGVTSGWATTFATATTLLPDGSPNFTLLTNAAEQTLNANYWTPSQIETPAPHLKYIGGRWHIWYGGNLSVPNDIYHAVAGDSGSLAERLQNWTISRGNPVRPMSDRSIFADQSIDPFVMEVNGKTYMYRTAADNKNWVFKIVRDRYDGPIEQLLVNPCDVVASIVI